MTSQQMWELCPVKAATDVVWRESRPHAKFEASVKGRTDSSIFIKNVLEGIIDILVDIRHEHGHTDETKHVHMGDKVLTLEDFDMLYNRMDELWQKIFVDNCCALTPAGFENCKLLELVLKNLSRLLKIRNK
jgi:hypothetical protein